MLRLALCLLLLGVYTHAQLVNDPLCEGCVMINGAGFNSHPDCNKYVQCHYNGNGVLVGEVMRCPFATYWSMNFLTCMPSDQVECKNDMCAGKPDNTVYGSETNCRGYWQCKGGKAQPMCCPFNHTYDAAVGCVKDVFDSCNDTCFAVAESPLVFATCDKKAIPGKPDMYQQEVAGWGILERPCSPGSLFVQDACACIGFSDLVFKPVCKLEVYLPFSQDHTDQSGNNFHVLNENVEVKNGMAIFNGVNSRLVIPRFTNLEHSTTVIIKAKYLSEHTSLTGTGHAIVSNSDCGNLPSILISEDNNNVYFGVGTNTISAPLFTYIDVPQRPIDPSHSEKEVLYKFDSGRLKGSNGVDEAVEDAPGYLRNVKCALQIGHSENLKPFKGSIDEISIYLCNP